LASGPPAAAALAPPLGEGGQGPLPEELAYVAGGTSGGGGDDDDMATGART